MATLYQLHSTMDTLRSATVEMAMTWRVGDSIVLLGSTVAFIDWLNAYLNDADIQGIKATYALSNDVAALGENTTAKLSLSAKLTALLTDNEWVALTQDDAFDKVVSIAL